MAEFTIPYTNGLQLRVILSGIMAGTVRSIVETPLEFAKVWKLFFEIFSIIFFNKGWINSIYRFIDKWIKTGI